MSPWFRDSQTAGEVVGKKDEDEDATNEQRDYYNYALPKRTGC